ncbi:uncharacterized protein BROUX77_005446 [Berkeleyomyces rouxiae]|uniref:uncharacterized protein n=1 Tax=Berkeleyomyces rouxiae TaxID=2035830 RepID=UPI003B801A46
MEYLGIQATPSNDMRYTQDTSSLSIEAVGQNELYSQPVLSSSSQYTTEGTSFYPSSHIFPSLGHRSRVSSSTSSSGVTSHTHRTTTLPHLGPQISTREQYFTATPSHRRTSEHSTRSPSFSNATARRHPISPPIPSPVNNYTSPTVNMEGAHFNAGKNQTQYPPLGPFVNNGTLQYTDNPDTAIDVDINGNIDKGFFLSPEGEWTCYRRNYFSCVCSYGLTPYYPSSTIQFTESNTSQPLRVYGFAMCISAVVAENDGHAIELVQHTPKRDKGPVMKPTKVVLSPRPPSNHHPLGLYGNHESRGYNEGFNNPQAPSAGLQAEHTFERIQFKQATANNGKRRAAQQYYHLMIELWANVGGQAGEKYIKVGHRKSAKMIVRGRSPGHYQSERRGSTSSGPGSGTGGVTGYHGGGMMDSGFGPVMSNPYGGGFDTRGGMPYSSTRHHQPHHQHTIPVEPLVSSEDSKAIETTRGYEYYPSTIYESSHENKPSVDMFSHQQRNDGETTMGSGMVGAYDPLGPRSEGSGLPSLYNAGALVVNRRYGQFEGRSKSDGCYPTMMSQSGMNIS